MASDELTGTGSVLRILVWGSSGAVTARPREDTAYRLVISRVADP